MVSLFGLCDILKYGYISNDDPSKCRVGIELKFDSYTKEIAEAIIDAGFFAAAWKIGHRNMDEYRRVMSYGVTEFTEDYHCSMGLNW